MFHLALISFIEHAHLFSHPKLGGGPKVSGLRLSSGNVLPLGSGLQALKNMRTSAFRRIMSIPTGLTPITGTNINRRNMAPGEYIPSHRAPYESVTQGPQIVPVVRQASTDRRQSPDKNGGDGTYTTSEGIKDGLARK
jgi:hypothetical protein